jgi:hypothetical protein
LLVQQITSDAGIDSAAHAKQDALFVSRIHPRKIGESTQLVNERTVILSEVENCP